MNFIDYPYIPEDRNFIFVDKNNSFMMEADTARQEYAGDSLFPVGVVLVKDGVVLVRAGNGYNRGKTSVHVCPRVVNDCPSGEGYELCDLHDSPGHAESMLMQVAKQEGVDPAGGDVYLYGHWWCCKACWKIMIQNGIKNVYLLENAHEIFHRDRVYATTLQTSLKSVCLIGDFDTLFADVCRELGCLVYQGSENKISESDAVILNTDINDLSSFDYNKPIILISKKESFVPNKLLNNSNVVYHVEYSSKEEALRKLRNTLKQL